MELLGRTLILTSGCLMLLGGFPVLTVHAEESLYPVIDGAPEDTDSTLELTIDEGEYTVLNGDSLWRIAEKLWDNGFLFKNLIDANQDVLQDPNLIYPDMILHLKRTGYIRRHSPKDGQIVMGNYSFDTPYHWTFGYLQEGEASANAALSDNTGNHIACLVRDKESSMIQSTQDWEVCTRKIQDYVQEHYRDFVSDLNFEHYQMPQDEELYLYSFLYTVNLSPYGTEGSMSFHICVGIKLTKRIQAEFIGFGYDDYDMLGTVRYVAASLEEESDTTDADDFTVNDSNMAIAPVYEWELSGMYNPFPWIEEYFDSVFRTITGTRPENEDPRERLMDQLHSL